MDLLWFGLLLILLGLLPAALLLRASRRSAEPPEITAEELSLPAASHVTRPLMPGVDSRYSVHVTTATPVAANPGPLFDACLCPDLATSQLFDQGQPLPQPRVQVAQQVAVWRASIEIAAGQEALLVLSNPDPDPLVVSLAVERQAIPPALRGRRGSFFLWAALAGIAGAIAGALLAFVGLGQRVF